MLRRISRMFSLVLLALVAPCILAPASRAEDRLLVFAAASLTDALNEVGKAYATSGAEKPRISFAGSSALARQIENGAPAAIFISADEQWMDYLASRGLIVEETRRAFLGNRLVLVAPAAQPFHAEIALGFPLGKFLSGEKLAMADPDSVPAGRYGKAALVNLGVWQEVERNVIRAENVRAALTFVARDEAGAGVVYATDAMISKNVVVAGVFPETCHPPITYPVAVIAGHDTPAARAFYAYLLSAPSADIFRRHGFIVRHACADETC